MGMRFLGVVLTLGMLLITVAGQQNLRAPAKKAADKESAEPAADCASPPHAHFFYDMRLAHVEVTSSDDCGFNYTDLETNTTGMDNHFQFSDGFMVVRAAGQKADPQLIRSDVLPRKAIYRGMRGIAIYCHECKTVTLLKVVKE